MSQANVEVVRTIVEGARGDWNSIAALFHPDVRQLRVSPERFIDAGSGWLCS